MHIYKRLLAQEPFLRLLERSNPKQRRELLSQATKEELTTLFEVCLNIIKGHIPVEGQKFKQLKRYRNVVRQLGDRKVALKKKKRMISQEGGAVGAVVGTVASLILPLLAKLIK